MDTTTAAQAAMAPAGSAGSSVPPLTAHLTSRPPPSEAPHVNLEQTHLSRAHVPWRPEVWAAIDRAVAYEVRGARKATKVVRQLRVAHHVTNVEQDVALQNLNPGSPPFVPPKAALAPGATPPTLTLERELRCPVARGAFSLLVV